MEVSPPPPAWRRRNPGPFDLRLFSRPSGGRVLLILQISLACDQITLAVHGKTWQRQTRAPVLNRGCAECCTSAGRGGQFSVSSGGERGIFPPNADDTSQLDVRCWLVLLWLTGPHKLPQLSARIKPPAGTLTDINTRGCA